MIIAGIFENILGFNSELATRLVSRTNILPWLLSRIQSKTYDENRGYAAEIMSIVLQNNRLNRLELGNKDGVEIILKVLSVCSSSLFVSMFSSRMMFRYYSTIAREIQSMQMRQNSWRMSSTYCVQRWLSLRSKSSSSIAKELILWYS